MAENKEEVKMVKETYQIFRASAEKVTKHKGAGWVVANQSHKLEPNQLAGFEWDGSKYKDRGEMVLMVIPVRHYEDIRKAKEKITEEKMKGVELANKKLGFEKKEK